MQGEAQGSHAERADLLSNHRPAPKLSFRPPIGKMRKRAGFMGMRPQTSVAVVESQHFTAQNERPSLDPPSTTAANSAMLALLGEINVRARGSNVAEEDCLDLFSTHR